MKIRKFFTKRSQKTPHEVTMRDRFMSRVLLPPFILLLIIGGVGFWRLNDFLRTQAVKDLQTAAQATAIRLEREVAIRQTILANTAEEITEVKNAYTTDLQALESNRAACREYYQERFRFTGAPNGACDLFIRLSSNARPSLALIEDIYIEEAKSLQATEINTINQRLTTFKLFFPEIIALLVVGEDGRIVSSAVSGGTLSSDDFLENALLARTQSIEGKVQTIDGLKLTLFGGPTSQGAVLAAYDVNNENYLRPTWLSTPIEAEDALPLIVDIGDKVVYPNVRDESEVLAKTTELSNKSNITTKLSDVENVIVSTPVAGTTWSVMVASPEAIVYAPLRDTQFTAVVIAGLFVMGFLWVGTFFIQRTTNSIAQLVTAAMVYGSGRLDYKLTLPESEKEFRQLADTMNYMARRIAESEREIDEKNKEFISIATHELRAPMTSIIGYLSMLKENLEKKLDKENTLLFDSAYDGTIKLRDLVNDMLDAARLEGGREEFVIKKLLISDYIEATMTTMQVVAKQNNITLSYDKKDAASVYADEAKLRIILNNFLSNAVKYNRHGGHVKVNHSLKEGQLVTSIANNGPSIPTDQQAHMFEKFFRVDTPEHRKITGTGIGMYVTKQYIEAMNGKVWFTSSPGEDTVFYFSLPIEGNETTQNVTTAPKKPTNSKWIMRWRRRLR